MSGPPTDKGGTWWVEIIYSEINILQLNYPKVVQSATKPSTGQRLTYFVSGVQGPWKTRKEALDAAHGYSGIVNRGGVGSGDSGGGGGFLGLGHVDDFFHRLSEKATWIRVGEVAIGGIVVYVALRSMASGTAAGEVGKTVAKPAKSYGRGVKRRAKTVTSVVVERKFPKPTPTRRYIRESHVFHHTAANTPKPKPKAKVGP